MKVKVSDAEREMLDWMVAMAEWTGHQFLKEERFIKIFLHQNRTGQGYCYSRDWSLAGPIIEREGISLTQFSDYPQWTAKHPHSICYDGNTPLIAAMRCYVASKLGEEVDVPDDIVWDELIYDKGDE